MPSCHAIRVRYTDSSRTALKTDTGKSRIALGFQVGTAVMMILVDLFSPSSVINKAVKPNL